MGAFLLTAKFSHNNDEVLLWDGGHIPVALSFDVDEGGYTLTEYWESRGGGDYGQDIREKFRAHIVQDGMDSQKFILQQIQEC